MLRAHCQDIPSHLWTFKEVLAVQRSCPHLSSCWQPSWMTSKDSTLWILTRNPERQRAENLKNNKRAVWFGLDSNWTISIPKSSKYVVNGKHSLFCKIGWSHLKGQCGCALKHVIQLTNHSTKTLITSIKMCIVGFNENMHPHQISQDNPCFRNKHPCTKFFNRSFVQLGQIV